MTQPKIEGVGHGVPRMLYASDGSNWYAVLVDSDGHIKVDVVSAALGTDAATETTLALIKGYVDNLETLLAGGLPAALDTLALKVKEQSPITGFATATNQSTMITALQLIDDLRAALGSVATDTLKTVGTVTATSSTTFTYATVTMGVAAAVIKAANTDRFGIAVFNLGSVTIYLGKDNTVTVAAGFPLLSNQGLYFDGYAGALWGISGTAGQDVRYLEV